MEEAAYRWFAHRSLFHRLGVRRSATSRARTANSRFDARIGLSDAGIKTKRSPVDWWMRVWVECCGLWIVQGQAVASLFVDQFAHALERSQLRLNRVT
jgi:hypothetical protein